MANLIVNEQVDNLICTFVKIYPFNITFALNRASQMTGVPYSKIRSRYYDKLRHEREIFTITFGSVTIVNKARLTQAMISDLGLLEQESLQLKNNGAI